MKDVFHKKPCFNFMGKFMPVALSLSSPGQMMQLPKRHAGAVAFEAAICLPLLIIVIIGGFDFLNLMRYSSGAYSIALTAARVASVERPDDRPGSAPLSKNLKIPVAAAKDYLRTYEFDNCGGANSLDDHKRRVINLALGRATEVFVDSNLKTASNWFGVGQSSNTPLPGEFIVVPDTCNSDNMEWRVCINVPLMIGTSKYICRVAKSDMWKST